MSFGGPDMDIVVGSGPSGLAVTKALLARGREVTMVDGGQVLSQADQARKTKMAATSPSDWTQEQIDAWQAPQFSPRPGMVSRYGSNHALTEADQTLDNPQDWFALRASHAVGGLSNVWGGAVLPSRQADIVDWPINTDDLAPHYKAVSEFMPMSGRADRLEALFPHVPMSEGRSLNPSPQGRKLLEKFDTIGDALARDGVHVGQARQAVSSDCQYCGMCLHGCPWNQIFSANHALADLQKDPNFTYLRGRIVTHFEQDTNHAKAFLKDSSPLTGDRLYLAAGILETARIVLASQPTPGASLTLLDSQHFFLPMLHRWKPDDNPETAPHHTLTEAFVEMDDKTISPYLTHTQIYGWNEFYAREMIGNYGPKLPGGGPLFRAVSRRLMVAQTFLHSDHSAKVELNLGKNHNRLTATLISNPETEKVMAAASKKLGKSMSRAGLFALQFARRVGSPGSSFHTGGTLPMSASPNGLQTDGAGRLHGLDRVHVVDASILPSIPATTITFTVMANAHRIGMLS